MNLEEEDPEEDPVSRRKRLSRERKARWRAKQSLKSVTKVCAIATASHPQEDPVSRRKRLRKERQIRWMAKQIPESCAKMCAIATASHSEEDPVSRRKRLRKEQNKRCMAQQGLKSLAKIRGLGTEARRRRVEQMSADRQKAYRLAHAASQRRYAERKSSQQLGALHTSNAASQQRRVRRMSSRQSEQELQVKSKMEVISNKRPADNEEASPMESVALCHNCNRMTHNLKVCDNCNSSLSENNSSSCYCSEPKRSRLESSSLSIASEAGIVMETENSAPAIESMPASNTVRPETLFVNVHNHSVPLPSVTDASCPQPIPLPGPAQTVSNTVSASGGLPLLRTRMSVPTSHVTTATSNHTESAALINGNNVSSRPVLGTVTLNSRVAMDAATAVAGSNAIGQTRALGHSDTYSSRPTATAAITLPTYNLQPPPPPFASSVARLPVAVAASSVPNVVPLTGSAPSQNVSVSAIQIRIGSKKFKPISPVTFKDDGILFTLKDFTYAPVLLNARAIVKCKANLNTFSYPALFLFLENSCMRQIRQIFGLNANEFMANSDVEIKRCISIFPIFGIEGKQQVQQLTFSIKRSFEAMVKRYPRSSAILEEITNDAVINILLEGASSGSSAETNDATSSSASSTAPSSNARPQNTTAASTAMSGRSQMSTLSSSSYSQANGAPSSGAERSVQSQLSVDTSTVSAGLANRVIARGAPVAASTSSTTSAPILVMPSDASRWQTMTKGLVVGGVYHVQTLDKQKRYCLWNGTQLVPCFVQNTEVSVSCSQIRIGMMTAQCIGEVRVKVEGASGVYFTMKYETGGIQEIYLALSDMVMFAICISRMTVIFISLSVVGAEKLNAKVKSLSKDPVLSFSSTDTMKKYILIYVPMLNHDQEEALRHMSFPSNPSTLSSLSVLDHGSGLNILAGIRCQTSNLSTINEYLNVNKLSGASGFERLANEVSELMNMELDDDDDVIMTQEEIGIKCPYTQKVMIEPVQNKHCGHNYEKNGIQEFVLRKKGNAKCPYAGCGNIIPVRMEDLTDNVTLKEYISKMAGKPNTQLT